MSSESKEGIEIDNNSSIIISKWVYAVIIIGGFLAYYLAVPDIEKKLKNVFAIIFE